MQVWIFPTFKYFIVWIEIVMTIDKSQYRVTKYYFLNSTEFIVRNIIICTIKNVMTQI